MKRFIKLIPAALALVALASCSQDDLFSKENNQQAVDGKTMIASIEETESLTRAAFAENKNDAGKADKRALVWTVGDSYKVYGELATADKYTLQNASAGKVSGTFDLMTDDYNTEPAFAVFPYDDVEADRPSKKLTVKLNDWTYGTAEVKDEGYNQGGFKSVVPMYGIIGEDGEAAFGYMTALLRVDLQKLPKKMTRLIVVTDRPLKGTFEAEIPESGYPEIVSPVSNDESKETYSFNVDRDGNGTITAADDYTDLYFLAVGTESVNQRTNKTFFIPVPTGNKYKTFDVLVEYNMGSSKKYEIVAQLGAEDYTKVLKWERGKVKSLQKEITVTSGGNTPALLAAFLKAEWKTFPADADINITVTDAAGDFAAIDLTAGSETFEVPAEVKGRTINIIVDPSIAEAYINGTAMTIVDEDPAPVASEPLRLINICGATANNTALTLDCPETQVVLSAPEGATATYAAPAKVVVAEEAGLVIEKDVTVGDLTVTGGAVINNGTTGFFYNKGDNDMKITGTSANVKNLGKGALTIEGTATVPATITGYIYNGDGTAAAGKMTIKNAVLGGAQIRNYANADNGIEIENVDQFKLADAGKGAVSIKKVTTSLDDSNIDAAASLTLDDIAAAGTVIYKGAGAFSANAIKGAVTEFEATVASEFTVTGIENTIASLKYNGTGAATITGDASKPTAVTNAVIKGGAVAISNIKTNTGVTKSGSGALTITNSALGTVTNAGGTITATGGTAGKSITSLTQNGAAKVTLTGMQDVTTLKLGADGANVDYTDTFIATLDANNKKTEINGTKASGIGIVSNKKAGAGNFVAKTDTWDGTSKSTTATDEIYTSASFAKLADAAGATVNLYLDLNMGGTTAFGGIKKGTITTFNGNDHKIENLKAANGMFAAGQTTAVIVNNLTLDKAVITDDKEAGCFIGKASTDFTFNSVNVTNATVGGTKFEGSSIGVGGFIGVVDGAANVNIYKCTVNTATLKGHYYVGGFIGQVLDGGIIKLMGAGGSKVDEIGTQAKSLTFDIQSKDGVWSTLKNGTVAPFIGGIKLLANLNIYGEYDSFDRTASKWNLNFLENEAIKFYGTKRDDLNFIGYTSVATGEGITGTYNLKLRSGFEANPSMKLANTANSLDKSKVLDIEYNAYLIDSQW